MSSSSGGRRRRTCAPRPSTKTSAAAFRTCHYLRLADEAPERVAVAVVLAGGALGLGRCDQRGERIIGARRRGRRGGSRGASAAPAAR